MSTEAALIVEEVGALVIKGPLRSNNLNAGKRADYFWPSLLYWQMLGRNLPENDIAVSCHLLNIESLACGGLLVRETNLGSGPVISVIYLPQSVYM